jgi:hypothetical protein
MIFRFNLIDFGTYKVSYNRTLARNSITILYTSPRHVVNSYNGLTKKNNFIVNTMLIVIIIIIINPEFWLKRWW